jgi:hypothetical protein
MPQPTYSTKFNRVYIHWNPDNKNNNAGVEGPPTRGLAIPPENACEVVLPRIISDE